MRDLDRGILNFRSMRVISCLDGPDAAEMAVRLAVEAMNHEKVDDGLGNRLAVG